MNTRQLTLIDLEQITSLISSYNPTLTSYHSVGSFNHLSQVAKQRLGKYYLEKLDLVSRFFTASYFPGDLHKQRIVTFKSVRSLFASQNILRPYIKYAQNLCRLIRENNLQLNTKCLRELLIKTFEWIINTERNRPGIQIRNGLLVKVGEFGYKKFRNCDREYEVNGLGPLSSATRDIVIQLMNIDATDLDQVSSSPTIAKHLLSGLLYRQMMTDGEEGLLLLERGIESIHRLTERKTQGEIGVKDKLNQTLYGSERHLNDVDCRNVWEAMEFYVTHVGGFSDFRSGRSWMSHQIFNIENKLQRTFERNLKEQGIEVLAHIYDGCVIYGHIDEKTLHSVIFKTEEETGIKMNWIAKKTWSKK